MVKILLEFANLCAKLRSQQAKPMAEQLKTNEGIELKRDFLSMADVATIYGVHVSTVRRMIKAGKLSAVRFGGQIRIASDSLPKPEPATAQ